jgi:hypothetical protein
LKTAADCLQDDPFLCWHIPLSWSPLRFGSSRSVGEIPFFLWRFHNWFFRIWRGITPLYGDSQRAFTIYLHSP